MMETLPASQALATQRVISSPSAWQVKTWRPWSAPQMQSGGELGLGVCRQCPSLEGLLPRVLSSCTPHLGQGPLNPDQHHLFPRWSSAILEELLWEAGFSSSFLNSVLYGCTSGRNLQLRKGSPEHPGTGQPQRDAACSCHPRKSQDEGMTAFSGHIKVSLVIALCLTLIRPLWVIWITTLCKGKSSSRSNKKHTGRLAF